MKRLVTAVVVGMLALSGRSFAADENPVAAGAKLVKASTGYTFTEGPACDKDGNVYFTDQPNDKIVKWSTDGKFETWLQPAGRSNGLCFDSKGNMLACADGKNEMWLITPDKKVTVLFKDFNGKLLDGPNDVWLDPHDGIYFSDPYYQRDYWKRGPKEQDVEAVYYLAPDHKKLVRVIADLVQPNGIIGTPDGKVLYVSDIESKKTYSYDIQPDGSLKNKKLFCEVGSDGMTLDNEGNVYLTNADGVSIFDKAGKKLQVIKIDEKWTGNICFGGKDRHTLFITASTSVYTIQMRTMGAGSQ